MNLPLSRRILPLLLLVAAIFSAPAQTDLTNSAGLPADASVVETPAPVVAETNAPATLVSTNRLAVNPEIPQANVTGALIRVMGMLALVIALFLGGVWVFRNWQRLTMPRGQAPKLNIIETRSLGGRHALFVVGYEHERFLIASSPAGINMLTHLHSAEEAGSDAKPAPPATQPSFGETLAQMLKGGKRP